MGRPARKWSFADVAAGVLDEESAYDLVVASFALHLVQPSYLHTTLAALARSARFLVIVTPHKRPVVDKSTGWREAYSSAADGSSRGEWEMVHERVRVRLYVSDGARPVEME